MRSGRPESSPGRHDPPILFDQSGDLGFHSEVERGMVLRLFGKEIKKFPLWHHHHEAAVRREARKIAQRDFITPYSSADLTDLFLMRALEKIIQHTELVHHFER